MLLCFCCVVIIVFYNKNLHTAYNVANNDLVVTVAKESFFRSFSDSVCSAVIEGNKTALASLKRHPVKTTDNEIKRRVKQGCWKVIDYYSFNTNWSKLTQAEKNYPVAYSILAHKNTQQLILLLAAIYSPQNVYCVHIDKKSEEMMSSFKLVQRCFPNVILASKRVKVVYASVSRLQADLNCMEDLLRSPIPWIHLINLCGQVRNLLFFPHL